MLLARRKALQKLLSDALALRLLLATTLDNHETLAKTRERLEASERSEWKKLLELGLLRSCLLRQLLRHLLRHLMSACGRDLLCLHALEADWSKHLLEEPLGLDRLARHRRLERNSYRSGPPPCAVGIDVLRHLLDALRLMALALVWLLRNLDSPGLRRSLHPGLGLHQILRLSICLMVRLRRLCPFLNKVTVAAGAVDFSIAKVRDLCHR